MRREVTPLWDALTRVSALCDGRSVREPDELPADRHAMGVALTQLVGPLDTCRCAWGQTSRAGFLDRGGQPWLPGQRRTAIPWCHVSRSSSDHSQGTVAGP